MGFSQAIQIQEDELFATRLQRIYEREARMEFDQKMIREQEEQQERRRRRELQEHAVEDDSMSTVSLVGSIYLPVEIHRQRRIAVFLDTGATHSYMSKSLLSALKLERHLDLARSGGMVVQSASNQIPILGVIRDVDIGLLEMTTTTNTSGTPPKSSFPFDFFVLKELPFPLIMGMDVVRKFRCNIDAHTNVVTFHMANLGVVSIPFLKRHTVQQMNGCL